MLLYDHLITLPEEVSPSSQNFVAAPTLIWCLIAGSNGVEEEENIPYVAFTTSQNQHTLRPHHHLALYLFILVQSLSMKSWWRICSDHDSLR